MHTSDPLSIPTAPVPKGAEEEFVRECINIWRFINEYIFHILFINFRRSIAEDWVRLGDIHVVHYEKVLRERVDVLSGILDFLDLKIDQNRMSCVEILENDMYKRKTGNQSFSPLEFTDVMRTEIVENILYIDALLQKYGHERIPLDLYSDFK